MRTQTQTPITSSRRRTLHWQYLPKDRNGRQPNPRSWDGLYPGEPESCRRSLRPFLRNLIFLGLLLLVFKVYKIEERAYQGRTFQTLATLVFLALPLHYLAPYRVKKLVLIAVSIAGLFWVFGIPVAALVLTFSFALIGICRLPIWWSARVVIVASLATALAFARGMTHDILPDSVWPIVASMFMFRIVIYLYELKHCRTPETLTDTLTYFFLLPNYSFMLFPVVDYRTMQQGYFADDVHEIQRRGLQMMFHGTTHLLCYRVIYHDYLIPVSYVHDLTSLACYLVCNYLLYLQVSGQFHMACGMLHLFGFKLPATHHHYMLATGFTDYWRRINIYWKDFMVRIIFNPVVFRFKRWPPAVTLGLATFAVFLATWVLHAYQSFWLRGTWGFTIPDALFWAILGALVMVNVQIDARRTRAGGSIRREVPWTPSDLIFRSLKIAGTFMIVALLWSLWSSANLPAWLDMLHRGIYGS
jgi:hypothetical protein